MVLVICSACWQFPPGASGRGEPQSQHQDISTQVTCGRVTFSPISSCLVHLLYVCLCVCRLLQSLLSLNMACCIKPLCFVSA